jgi:hypothetical protein
MFKLELGQMYTKQDFPKELRAFIVECSAQGSVDDACDYWKDEFEMNENDAKKHLKTFGAWEDEELEDHDDNMMRVVWLLACDLKENKEACLGE